MMRVAFEISPFHFRPSTRARSDEFAARVPRVVKARNVRGPRLIQVAGAERFPFLDAAAPRVITFNFD